MTVQSHPPSTDTAAGEERSPAHRRHAKRAAYITGALILVSLIVAVPLAMGSIVRELMAPPEKAVHVLSGSAGGRRASPASNAASQLTITLVSIDETNQTATLRIAGHRACSTDCEAFQLLFVALDESGSERFGLPPSATIDVTANDRAITKNIQLPIEGLASLYPFDHYTLVLGIAKLTPDSAGTPSAAASTARPEDLYLALESQLQKHVMLQPRPVRPEEVASADYPFTFNRVVRLDFLRPGYLQLLSVLLVMLMLAAALLSVTMEPMRRLLVGVGGLVLGIWGVRSILLAGAPPVITAVDLLLTAVILILLYGIAIRVVLSLRSGGWDGLHRHIRDG